MLACTSPICYIYSSALNFEVQVLLQLLPFYLPIQHDNNVVMRTKGVIELPKCFTNSLVELNDLCLASGWY